MSTSRVLDLDVSVYLTAQNKTHLHRSKRLESQETSQAHKYNSARISLT